MSYFTTQHYITRWKAHRSMRQVSLTANRQWLTGRKARRNKGLSCKRITDGVHKGAVPHVASCNHRAHLSVCGVKRCDLEKPSLGFGYVLWWFCRERQREEERGIHSLMSVRLCTQPEKRDWERREGSQKKVGIDLKHKTSKSQGGTRTGDETNRCNWQSTKILLIISVIDA